MKDKFRIPQIIIFILALLLIQSCKKTEDNSIKDGDGNVYTSVEIGTQVWLVENLKTTKYNDGTSISNVTDNTAWENLTSPAYCWYNNDASNYKSTYGALYNWYAVNTGKLCPIGWHVPADTEWHQLVLFLDPDASLSSIESLIAGNKIKESGTSHWQSPNSGATNESGFKALPGGGRGINGEFGYALGSGNWWSSTENVTGWAWYRALSFDTSIVYRGPYSFWLGISVRCIKDN